MKIVSLVVVITFFICIIQNSYLHIYNDGLVRNLEITELKKRLT